MTDHELAIVRKHLTWALAHVSVGVNTQLGDDEQANVLVALERHLREAMRACAVLEDQ
jgi:hypothetical protein